MTTPTLEATPCKRRRDADAVWCHGCGKIIADRCDPYWDMSKSRAMHERGTGHRTTYVVLRIVQKVRPR